MTLADQTAQYGDRHPQGDGGAGRPGPNKDSMSNPSGGGVLGNEFGAEGDARRERAQAIREGDQLPSQSEVNSNSTLAGLTPEQRMGAEKGYGQGPSDAQREQNQQGKNQAASGDAIDARQIARNSAGTANHNPTQDQNAIRSMANSNQGDVLETATRSGGTESGFNAYTGGIVNQAETNNIAP